MHAKYLLYISGLALAALLAAPREAIGVCSFNSTPGVDFGAYNVFNTSLRIPPAVSSTPASFS